MPRKTPRLPTELAELILELSETDTRRLNGLIWLLNEAGWPLQSMGNVLGVSRQRIEQRRNSYKNTEGLPSVPSPPKPEPPVAPPKPVRPHLDPETIKMLREMREISSTVNGGTPVDDPRRKVSVAFSEVLAKLIDEQGISILEIAGALGVTRGTIQFRLSRHGYRPMPASQSRFPYRGIKTGSR